MSEKNLRDQLFPNGKPEPEEAIRLLVAYIRGKMDGEAAPEE